MDSGNPRQAGQVLPMDALEILGVGHHHPNQVVEFPGHEITVHDLRHGADGILENLEFVLVLALQGDAHEDDPRKAGLLRVHPRRVPLDQALLLQGSDAAQAGRLRQVNLLGELNVGDAPFALKGCKNGTIVGIHGRNIRPDIREIRNNPPYKPPRTANTQFLFEMNRIKLWSYRGEIVLDEEGRAMRIGVPKEIKVHEYRVGIVPSGVRDLVAAGHELCVETGAGAGIGFSDEDYVQSGATIAARAEEVFEAADLLVKVKEPQLGECARLRSDQVLFTYLHLAADPDQAAALCESGVTAIAYETVTAADGSLPLLTPMSEVAGRMSVQVGAAHLQKAAGGAGILLGGVPGVDPAKVVILGGGVAGTNAAEIALGMQADVTVVDLSAKRLRELSAQFGGRLGTAYSSADTLERLVVGADLVIGAVLIPGAAAPRLVSRDMVKRMKAGSVLVDISIDQGGCFETSRATSHADPTFVVDDVIHYCVSNMPGGVPRTSTFALTNVTLPYVRALADFGWEKACAEDPHLAGGLNVQAGRIVHDAIRS